MSSDALLNQIHNLRNKAKPLEMSGDEFLHHCQDALKFLIPLINTFNNAPGFPENSTTSALSQLEKLGLNQNGAIQDLISTQLTQGMETASGNFMGYIPGGGLPSGAIADLIVGVINRFSGYHYTSPGSANTENKVIRWFCELFDLGPEAWGCLTSGGTSASLNALLAARETLKDQAIERQVIYLTDQAHLSANRTLKTIGLNRSKIHSVGVNDRLQMDIPQLKQAIEVHLSEGIRPFMVIATAGTTNTGSIDSLSEVSDLCKKYGLWMHVDAAYGGLFMLTEEGQKKFKGIQNADSIMVDPHKGMFMPYGVGACLVKNHATLKAAFFQDAPYLVHKQEEARSPADYSFELTRHNRAPRIQLSLDLYGEAPFRAALQEKLLLTKWLYQSLKDIPGITLFSEPELTVVAFRADQDTNTEDLHQFILADGQLLLSTTRFHGRLWIRACLLSFRTHQENVKTLIDRVRSWGQKRF